MGGVSYFISLDCQDSHFHIQRANTQWLLRFCFWRENPFFLKIAALFIFLKEIWPVVWKWCLTLSPHIQPKLVLHTNPFNRKHSLQIALFRICIHQDYNSINKNLVRMHIEKCIEWKKKKHGVACRSSLLVVFFYDVKLREICYNVGWTNRFKRPGLFLTSLSRELILC